jgi:hypothetical protein
LKQKSIGVSEFSHLWRQPITTVFYSVTALDSARADELQLLRADETDDTTRKLLRPDRALELHLEDLKEALAGLPSMIADMKERCAQRANPSANLD